VFFASLIFLPAVRTPQPYNFKSDVWAFGCCMYEIATLKQAFNAKKMSGLMMKVIQGEASLRSPPLTPIPVWLAVGIVCLGAGGLFLPPTDPTDSGTL
jgi:serine/threonine protein kinase